LGLESYCSWICRSFATLPLSLYYFHQFPSYFWLSGLAVIPLSTIALYAGILLLVTDWIPYLGETVGWITYLSLAVMMPVFFAVQKIPLSVITGFWLEFWEMLLWYILIFLAAIAFVYKSRL
jgi:competence protein ComEC